MPRKDKPTDRRSQKKRIKMSGRTARREELDMLERTGKQVDHLTPRTLYRRNPKTKHAEEEVLEVSFDPRVLLEGDKNAIVEISGMYFRVRSVKLASGTALWVIYLTRAAPESPLADIAGTNIYLSVRQLYVANFQSPLVEYSEGWCIQKRMWDFLNAILVERGIKRGR